VTLSALNFPVRARIEALSKTLSEQGCQVVELATDELEVNAAAIEQADAHIIVMTVAWLDCPWSVLELMACIELGIPTLVLIHALPDKPEHAAIRHCLRKVLTFGANGDDEHRLRSKLWQLIRLGHLHYEARQTA